MFAAESRYRRFGAAIDQRVLHLVGDNANAGIGDDAQTLGIEIGEGEMTYLALMLHVGEMLERIEVAAIGVVPPMELQKVEALDVHARERASDRVVDHPSRNATRPRYPFGECLNLRKALRTVTHNKFAPKLADEILGGPVMVGKIPARKSGVVIRKHLGDRALRIDVPMRTGDLPHAVEDPADAEIGGKLETARYG